MGPEKFSVMTTAPRLWPCMTDLSANTSQRTPKRHCLQECARVNGTMRNRERARRLSNSGAIPELGKARKCSVPSYLRDNRPGPNIVVIVLITAQVPSSHDLPGQKHARVKTKSVSNCKKKGRTIARPLLLKSLQTIFVLLTARSAGGHCHSRCH